MKATSFALQHCISADRKNHNIRLHGIGVGNWQGPRATNGMGWDVPFFHHYQGSIDFNTVNIHRTVGMYFLVSTGNRGDIEWHDLQRSYYPIHSLLPGVYVSILSLGTVFPRTLPMANIRNTSSRGKHWQCSSNDADRQNYSLWYSRNLFLKNQKFITDLSHMI